MTENRSPCNAEQGAKKKATGRLSWSRPRSLILRPASDAIDKDYNIPADGFMSWEMFKSCSGVLIWGNQKWVL